MYSVPHGSSRTVELGAGDTLTVSAESGRVWQLSDAGVPATLLANLSNGELKVLGPFPDPRRYHLEALSGPLSYGTARPGKFKAALERATDVITSAANIAAAINTKREPAIMADPIATPAAPATPSTPAKGVPLPSFGALATALDKLKESLAVRGQRVLARIEATDARGAVVEAKAIAYLVATDAALDAHGAQFDAVEAATNNPPSDGSPK